MYIMQIYVCNFNMNTIYVCIYIYRLLQRSMKTRYPYVDPLNVIQAEAMKRWDSVCYI